MVKNHHLRFSTATVSKYIIRSHLKKVKAPTSSRHHSCRRSCSSLNLWLHRVFFLLRFIGKAIKTSSKDSRTKAQMYNLSKFVLRRM